MYEKRKGYMVIKYFIGVICIYFVLSFQAQAFDFGAFAKKTLEDAKKAQAAKQNNEQGKPENYAAPKADTRLPSVKGKFDILGMYPGMLLNDARLILKNHKPALQFQESLGDIAGIPGSRIRGLRYLAIISATPKINTGIGGDKFYLRIYAPPNDPSVSFIKRDQHLGKQILLRSDLRALLIEKYGTPSIESEKDISGRKNGAYHMYWSFKPDDSLLTEKNAVISCMNFTLLNDSSQNEKNKKLCGVTIYVKMNPADGTTREHPLVGFYSIFLTNVNKTLEMNQRTVDYTIVEAKKLETERVRKAARSSRPKL